MSCLGVHFALTPTDEERLLNLKSDQQVIEFLQEEIEELYLMDQDGQWAAESEKAWDAIHRCLTDGKLGFRNGEYPLSHCVLGGRQLYAGDDYIVSYKTFIQVEEISHALRMLSDEVMTRRYWQIDRATYQAPLSEEDLGYTLAYFEEVSDLYVRATEAKRAVVFTADQ